MASGAVDAFISYSREDAEFVDRLEADLRARGFNIWVDRRRLEGGSEWEQELERAIAAHTLTIVSLSPRAVQSPYVRWEYETALRLGKRMVPVLYKVCPIPSALDKFQWIDFAGATDYAHALKELVYACQDPSLNLTAESTALYNQALTLEGSDPERAAILLQRILDRDPKYFGGQVANDLARLEQRLYASRVARSKAQAEQARKQGEYGAEAGALEAILALGSQDTAVYAWAQEYLPVARQNRALLGPYDVIQQRVAAGDRASAAERLQVLWRQAPYFRDPAGIAPALGLTVPPTYEEAKARHAADDLKQQQETSATTERDAARGRADADMQEQARQAQAKWQLARDFMQGDLSEASEDAVGHILERLEALSSDAEAQSYIKDLTITLRQLQSDLKAVDAATSDVQHAAMRTSEFVRWPWISLAGLLLTPVLGCGAGVFAMDAVDYTSLSIPSDPGYLQPLFRDGGILMGILAIIMVGLTIFTLRRSMAHAERIRERARADANKKLMSMRQNADRHIEESERLYQEWLSEAESQRKERIRVLEIQRQSANGATETHCQQRIAEIATEYQSTMDAITQRYRQA